MLEEDACCRFVLDDVDLDLDLDEEKVEVDEVMEEDEDDEEDEAFPLTFLVVFALLRTLVLCNATCFLNALSCFVFLFCCVDDAVVLLLLLRDRLRFPLPRLLLPLLPRNESTKFIKRIDETGIQKEKIQ